MKKGNLILMALAGLALLIAIASVNTTETSQTTQTNPRTSPASAPSTESAATTQSGATYDPYRSAANNCGFDYAEFDSASPVQLACFEAKMEERQSRIAENQYRQAAQKSGGGGMGFLFNILLMVGIFFAFRWFMQRRQGGGGGGGTMGVGKSKAKLISASTDVKTFEDVAGAPEAKEAAQDFIDLLKNPQKYAGMGCKMPKGALLVGDPGNGKTLLAKAIAGEAGVPFYATSGSEFVEMYVGVGASRIRDMFNEARKNAPCIIFIDEIDAVGKQRGGGMSGSNDEREQTLNQLLVEMDGMGNDGEAPIIIFAATNRPDILDNALTRPGRFDKQIVVPNPDFHARIEIFKVHLRNKPSSPDVDLRILAGASAGMSGASIEAICNQAGILAVKRGNRVITQVDIENAMEIMQMGAENRTLGMSDAEKEATAYHEAGHAVLQAHHNKVLRDKIYKATIVPRGRALGFVASRPDGDRVSMKFEEYIARLEMMLAGRVAEEIQYGFDGVSTGASNDYQQATKLTQSLIREGGYDYELIGRYTEDQGAIFGMGGGGGNGGVRLSEELTRKLESKEQALRSAAFEKVQNLMKKGENGESDGELHAAWVAIANALLAHETLTGEQVMKLYEDPTYDIASEFDADHTVPNAPRVTGIPQVRRKISVDDVVKPKKTDADNTSDAPQGEDDGDGSDADK